MPEGSSVAVDDAGEADGVVVFEQLDQEPILVVLRGLLRGRLDFDVARATAQNAGGLARLGVLLGEAVAAIGHLEILVDAAELQSQRVERGIGPGREHHGMLGRHGVKLRSRRIPLLAQPRDEHLAHHDPLPRLDGLRRDLM